MVLLICRSLLLSCLLLPFFLVQSQAQPETEREITLDEQEGLVDGVRVVGAVKGDSIVLRWGPTTPNSWLAGNQYGYVIIRRSYLMREDDTLEIFNDMVTPGPLRPWNPAQWDARIGRDTSRRWMIIAQQMLFNETSANQMGSSESSFGSLRMNAVELQNRHGIALFAADNDPEAAEGLGLRFVDHDIDTNRAYVYTVFLLGPDTLADMKHEVGITDALIPSRPSPVREPFDVRTKRGDGAITVQWGEVVDGGFSGYWVERQKSDGSWQRLNNEPIVYMGPKPTPVALLEPSDTGMVVNGYSTPPKELSFTDSSITNYQRYRYRVRGRDPFGDLSNGVVVEGMGRDLTSPTSPEKVGAKETGEGEVTLNWEMTETAGDLAGFVIQRGPTVDGPFRVITGERPLPPGERTYIVRDANEWEAYYFIQSVDTAGNAAASLTLLGAAIDRTPPSMPTGLAGVVDTSGRITIRWNRGSENDILGYRVYFANDSTDEFALIHDDLITDTLYVDSLRIQTATNEIYYRVKAYDRRRSQSPMSAILTVMQPDLIPPNARAFGEVTSTDSSVILRWHRGPARDVATQVLLRRTGTSSERWTTLARLDGQAEMYEDTTTDRKEAYNYTIVAIDDVGLVSDTALPVYAGSYNRVEIVGITGLEGEFDRAAGAINLRWEYNPPDDQKASRLVLYRGPVTGKYERYRELNPAARTFTVDDAWDQPAWKYAVVVETSEGGSPLTDGIIVVVN